MFPFLIQRVEGDRAFSVAGPRLWNSLPVELQTIIDITMFQSKLKTHLFKIAFKGHLRFYLHL